MITNEYDFPFFNINEQLGNVPNYTTRYIHGPLTTIEPVYTPEYLPVPYYDVWVRFDRGANNGDWILFSKVSQTSLNMPHPSVWTINGVDQLTLPNRLSVEVYVHGTPQVRSDGVPFANGTSFLKVYQVLNHTV